MNKETQTSHDDMGQLADDARTLLAATSTVAGEEITEARKRLAAALEHGKEICSRVQERAAEGVKAADRSVRENPYQAIAISLGVGALLGYLAGRRCNSHRD